MVSASGTEDPLNEIVVLASTPQTKTQDGEKPTLREYCFLLDINSRKF